MALGSAELSDRSSSLGVVVVLSLLAEAQLWGHLLDREVCWNVFVCRIAAAGCGETQEGLLSGIVGGIRDFDDIGMTTTMEQIVTQLQQKVFALKAQVADQSGLADAVRAVNNLATAQGEKDTPSLIDLKGVGRPKEFSGTEEGFQKWSKKTEAFFAGVMKESEMMLEWAAEQPTGKEPVGGMVETAEAI